MKNVHLMVASSEWEQDQLRYRRHRLAEYLRQQQETAEVIWICPSPAASTDGLTTLPNGIKQWIIEDLLPFKFFRFSRFIDFFYREKLNPFLEYLRSLDGRYYLWYTFPGLPLLADLLPWEKVIYDCSDLWTAPIGGKRSLLAQMRHHVIYQAENRIIKRADQIYCTSDYLNRQVAARLPADEQTPLHTFENGVEFDWFIRRRHWVQPVLPDEFSGPVLGYIGGIKPKLDFELIRQAAERKPDWFFLFVGPDKTGGSHDFQRLCQLKNVRWIGSVQPEDVPDYMALLDIGMMPYKSSPYNAAVFPLKLFEFLAAGKPVVGVCLPSTKKYAEDQVYASLDEGDPSAFIEACDRLLDSNQRTDSEHLCEHRRALARQKDWPLIFEQMTAFLKNKSTVKRDRRSLM
ncbi:MAG: glycosyltransferase [Sporolactobacillus sp.]